MWARRVLGPIAAALVLGFQWLVKLKFLIFAARSSVSSPPR